MLSNLSRQDRIAIFRKLNPVSFSRVYRTCKWANTFIEDNKREIKIHTAQSIYFKRIKVLEEPGTTAVIRTVIQICSQPEEVLKSITYHGQELETILSEITFQCFVFDAVLQQQEFPDNNYMLERLATIAARELYLFGPAEGPFPKFAYNYDKIEISRIKSHTIDALFDLAQLHSHVVLNFDYDTVSVNDVMRKCCELMQKGLEGKSLNKQMFVFSLPTEPRSEVLDRFLKDKLSETVVLAEEEYHFIPVSPRSLLSVKWTEKSREGSYFAYMLIEHSDALNEFCWDCGFADLSKEEFERLPAVVQQIFDRFFA